MFIYTYIKTQKEKKRLVLIFNDVLCADILCEIKKSKSVFSNRKKKSRSGL